MLLDCPATHDRIAIMAEELRRAPKEFLAFHMLGVLAWAHWANTDGKSAASESVARGLAGVRIMNGNGQDAAEIMLRFGRVCTEQGERNLPVDSRERRDSGR